MAEKNEEFKGVTADEAYKIILAKRHEILDHFAKAYIAETGLKPSEIELCTQQNVNGTMIENVFFFRRKAT